MRLVRVVGTLALLALLVPLADAHLVLLPGAGDSLGHASDLVAAPARAFDEIAAPGGYHYYAMNLTRGESVRVRLLARGDAFRADFPPHLLVAGPGVEESGFRPAALAFPNGTNVSAFVARFGLPDATDDRLSWRARTLVDAAITPNATGRFVIVVYSGEFGGRYALWVEHAQPDEMLDRIEAPFERPQAWTWSGIPPLALLAAALGGAGLPAAALAPRWRRAWEGVAPRCLAVAALVTGASGGARMLAAAWMGAPWTGTAIELAAALAAAALVWTPPAWGRRVACALLAAACVWQSAGWIVAPGFLLVAAVWVPRKRGGSARAT